MKFLLNKNGFFNPMIFPVIISLIVSVGVGFYVFFPNALSIIIGVTFTICLVFSFSYFKFLSK